MDIKQGSVIEGMTLDASRVAAPLARNAAKLGQRSDANASGLTPSTTIRTVNDTVLTSNYPDSSCANIARAASSPEAEDCMSPRVTPAPSPQAYNPCTSVSRSGVNSRRFE